MKHIPLLLIGTACDGPTEEPIAVTDYSYALELFGVYTYDAYTLTASSTGLTLSQQPWNSAIDVLSYDTYGDLTPYYLCNLTASSSSITFARPGESKEIVIRYLRHAADTALTKGLSEATTAGDVDGIYLMRLGGSTAKTQIGSGSSYITLESVYGGELYNYTSVSVSGSYLLVTPPPGKGLPRSYRLPTTYTALADAINTDVLKGYGVVKAEAYGDGTITSVTGTLNLTGGTDGDISMSELQDVLERLDLNGVSVVSILGMDYTTLVPALTDDFFESMCTPTMVVQGVTPAASGVASADYADDLIESSPSCRFLSLTASEGLFNPYYGVSYWNSTAVPYAVLLSKELVSTSWKPIHVADIRPNFSPPYIESLSSNGYVVLNRTISKNIAVYRGTTTDPTWNFACFTAYRTVCGRLYDTLSNYIGANNPVNREVLEADIGAALSGIPSIKAFDFSVEYYPQDINVSITLYIVGELRAITFSIGVSTITNA